MEYLVYVNTHEEYEIVLDAETEEEAEVKARELIRDDFVSSITFGVDTIDVVEYEGCGEDYE